MANAKTRSSASSSARSSQPPTKNSPQESMSSRDRWALVAIALLMIGVLGFLALRGSGSSQTSTTGAAELEHVHGLGVNPGDNTLYAGTHYGLFRLTDQGQVTRIADRVQDFMGFTVAGPDHFLASGHPGEDQNGPSSLGLIESTDGGQTWQSLSLAGEADFHALEYRHEQVYGVNSMTGEFMVSTDKKNWDTRTNLPMADFAVSPDDQEVIIATTEQGLARSQDGGRNFGPVRGAPLMLLVSWADEGTLVGLGPEGTVYVSSDGGEAWEERARLDGSPEALVAVNETEIYAVAGGAVLSSTDGGRNFTVRYKD
ncbi:MAG: exo-alpha-sialidase [Nocardioidaceae bacterium]|nr:exo-alpha-sialidase [Nocardioidaceae bacterium]